MYPEMNTIIDIVINEGVKIVFTSAGNPKMWTGKLHNHGIIVGHVIASTRFARNAKKPVWMLSWQKVLKRADIMAVKRLPRCARIPAVRKITSKPLLAAGGIASGEAIAAAMALVPTASRWVRVSH